MRFWSIISILLAAASTASAFSMEDGKLIKVEIGSGTPTGTAYVWSFPNDEERNGPLSVVAVVSSSPKPSFRIFDVRKEGRIYELLQAVECEGAIALSNGGFYLEDDDGKPHPMGLAIASDETINPFRPRRFGGYAVLEGGKPAILPVKSRNRAEAAEQAIQSSPIVVANGANDMNSDDGVKFNRTAVGITSDGRTVLVGAFRTRGSAISLYDFADAIVGMNSAGGPEIDVALALDGGPSSQILIPSTGDVYGYDGPNYLPNAVCLDFKN